MAKSDVKSKIEKITSRLEDLCEERNYLGLKEIAGGSSTVGWRRLPTIFGRDEDRVKILEMVLTKEPNDEANFHVIPIVGLGGVGKTTLAREVYNDKAVEDFNPKAWVCVSDDYDVLRISKEILESITSFSCSLTNLNEVQVQLKRAVTGKKFLVVLDDIWSKSYNLWEILKSPFMVGAPGSKIIVTTRIVDVALTMGHNEYYHLKLLSNDACWAIFEKHVLGNKVVASSPNLDIICDKVVERCKGLPLAARTLGGLLRCKQKYEDWEDILHSKIWELPEENGILPVLRLSYHHLPAHLKKCFAYCAIFPKDYEFMEKEVVLLWIAEGLIQQSKNNQLEDIGGEYFRDLVSRSLLQHSSINDSKFVMHDLVNDLAKYISGETSFILEDDLNIVLQSNNLERIRHSSYTRRKYEVKSKFEVFHRVEHLRTFLSLWLRDDQTYVTNTVISDLFSKLKKLRVLSLANYYIVELPSSIGGLRHLRYLDLSRTMITSLPESTSSLFNLQILLLRKCRRLINLPSNIRNLINLRHLDISDAKLIREMPLGIRKLKFLLTLSNFIVSKGIGSSLKDLKDLKFLRGKLEISGLENITYSQDTKEIILSDTKDLKVLVLEWSSSFNYSRDGILEKGVLDILQPHRNLKELTISNYGGLKFSSWVGDPSFSNMVVLKLDGCENCTSLPPLGLLSSLKSLMIKTMKILKKIGLEIYGGNCSKPFQSLETLCFENLLEWEHWDPLLEREHAVERFPCLRELSILECPKLTGRLPSRLPLLETLVINNCKQLVVSLSSLPMLRLFEVTRCKGVVYNSPTDAMSLNSLNNGKSNFPVFRNWSWQEYFKVENLTIVGCEELIHLWPNESFLEKPLKGLHSFT
ncbi:hypothetical protein Pint_07319 [Pistacia integerrima]|uniref:Uncharacterized protein n=1 Tax=Pistacia integerrima TaxID=434235 RepID=A0ACC0XU39_9ROSI|nr:hypothetical protein Pint_07319 [Pistacia integerrima]